MEKETGYAFDLVSRSAAGGAFVCSYMANWIDEIPTSSGESVRG